LSIKVLNLFKLLLMI